MIRFGVIGTNWITDRFLDAALQLDDFSLRAVYSRTEVRAKEFAEKYDVNATYTDLDAFSASDAIDAVYIASPTAFHKEHAITCMNGGKHVIVEKPFASNEKEVQEMIAVAKANNVTLMEAMKTTHTPNFQVVKDSLEKIGPVRRYIANFCQYSSRYDTYKEGTVLNAFKPELSNGSLMDIGVYCLYPMVALFGAPQSIQASAIRLDSGVDGQGNVLAQYEGMNGIAIFSKITDSNLPSEIQGEQGSIIIRKFSDMEGIQIVYRDGTTEDIGFEQNKNAMIYETKSFLETIENKELENPINTWERSIQTMQILDEARKQIGVIFPADSN